MRILVVDDEKLLVKGIKFNLENEGYDVDAAYDGEAALNMAKVNEYDLLILDIMMPKISGIDVCMKVREFSTVPIIMLTAKSEDSDKLVGFESGADDYITKPFNILELKARIRALLRRAAISEITLKLRGFRQKCYPIEVYAGKKKVWEGVTPATLGYAHIRIDNPVKAGDITIKMVGPAQDSKKFGELKELAGGIANEMDRVKSAKGKTDLQILEVDLLEQAVPF